MESIITACITGGLALLGVIITSRQANKKIVGEIKITQAVTDCKIEELKSVTNLQIEELTREVRAHNNFAQRMPVVEADIAWVKDKITYLHRNDKQ